MLRGTALVVTLGAACATPPGTEATSRAPLGPRPAVTATTWAALAADPTIAAIDGDVALACAAAPAGTDAVAARCDAVVISADGARAPLGRDDLLAAARLDATRLVLLTAGGELRVRAGGAEQVLARDARDPRVAPDRRLIAFTQYPAGGGPGGAPGRLVALDLDRGARWVIADDPLASSPFPIPGGAQVLYVSARTGLGPAELGARLQLPAWLEPHRAAIERRRTRTDVERRGQGSRGLRRLRLQPIGARYEVGHAAVLDGPAASVAS